ncbi:MAG: GTP 3',8-cyclase MoaA, partial [Thermoleophilia bacterium]
MTPLDRLQRPLRNLRLSVTDRCNLRCSYCMPEENYVWLPHRDILSFEEIGRLVDVFRELGVTKVRLTGGEPLLRKDLPELVGMLAAKGLDDLALTTTGVLLADQAEALARAGLHRLTVSLDTLDPARFEALSRRARLDRVFAGMEAARAAGLGEGLKIDTVLMRGVNDDEIGALVDFARAQGAELRFIEYMDVGGATRWTPETVVSQAEILRHLEELEGAAPVPIDKSDWAPANRWRLADGSTVGIIASTTAPFCRTCDRARLTADGTFYSCLYATTGLDISAPLRDGASPDELRELLAATWTAREDRGAER